MTHRSNTTGWRFIAGLYLFATCWGQGREVSSPDGRLVVRLELEKGCPTWSVRRDGQPLLQPGSLGIATGAQASAAVAEVITCGDAGPRNALMTTR